MPAQITQDDYLKDTSQFDLARKRAAEQSAANLQARKDALARRFASLGNLNSGARIKQEQLAADQEAANLNNANESINAQQSAELGRRKEVVMGQQFQAGEAEKGRQFSAEQAALQRAYGTSEREAGQSFASSQADLQRKFQTGERLSSQDFASLQAQLGRDFTKSEREALQDYQTKATDKAQEIQREQFNKTYGLEVQRANTAVDQFNTQLRESVKQYSANYEQVQRTFAEEVRINNKNIEFAQQTLDKKDFMDNLTSALGGGNQKRGTATLVGAGIGAFFGPVGALAGAGIGNAVGNWTKG